MGLMAPANALFACINAADLVAERLLLLDCELSILERPVAVRVGLLIPIMVFEVPRPITPPATKLEH